MTKRKKPEGPEVCAHCGKSATCFGRYEGHGRVEFACDGCCGHGCEDGWCEQLDPDREATP